MRWKEKIDLNHRPTRDELARRLFAQARQLGARMEDLEPEGRDDDLSDNSDEVVQLIQQMAVICTEARILEADARHKVRQ